MQSNMDVFEGHVDCKLSMKQQTANIPDIVIKNISLSGRHISKRDTDTLISFKVLFVLSRVDLNPKF